MDTNNTNNSNNQNNNPNPPPTQPQSNPTVPNAPNPNTNNTNNQPPQQQNHPQQAPPQNFNLNVTMAPPFMVPAGGQERGLFNLHHNMMQVYCRYFGPRARVLMEYTAFVHAITLLILVVVFHLRFVGKSVDCIPAALVANNITMENVEILQIQIVNSQTAERLQLYDRFLAKGKDAKHQIQNQKEAEKSEILFKDTMEQHSHEHEVLPTHYASAEVKEAQNSQAEDATDSTDVKSETKLAKESENADNNKLSELLLSHLLGEEGYKTLLDNYKQIAQEEEEHQRSMNDQESSSEYFLHEDWIEDNEEEEEDVSMTEDELLYFLGSPTFLFATEKAYLLMGDQLREKHNVSLVKISIPSLDECFASSTQRAFLEHFVGFDTIVLNSLAKIFRNRGYVYSLESFELYSLSSASYDDLYIEEIVFTKIGYIILSMFLYMLTTLMASLSLREAQARLNSEYLQLQNWQPVRRFLWLYFMKSMVVMMIGSGTWLVLAESLGDRGLAFLVLSLLWFSEFFVMISIRTPTSVQFFPSFFFLYFMVFHLYFYSYPFGFSYLAFFTWVGFTQHLVLFFLNRFEIPALANGTVAPNNPRPGSRRPGVVLRRNPIPVPQPGAPQGAAPGVPLPGAQPQPGGPGIRIPIPPGAQGISLRIQPGSGAPNQRGFQILIPQGRGRPPFPPQGPAPFPAPGPFPVHPGAQFQFRPPQPPQTQQQPSDQPQQPAQPSQQPSQQPPQQPSQQPQQPPSPQQ